MSPAGGLFAVIANSQPEPVLIFSPGGRLEALNEAASALTGLHPAAAGTVTLGEMLQDGAAAAVVLAAENAPRDKRAVPFLLTFFAPGSRRASFRGERWLIAGATPAVGLRLFEPEAVQHRRVLARIADGLTTAMSRPPAECQAAGLAATITEVCAFTGWEYAEVWLADDEGVHSQSSANWEPHPFWYGNRRRFTDFRELSMKAAAAAPLPLVSRVAREQSALWFSDVSTVPLAVYRRARAAREAGLKATFAQPIVEGGRTLAVLVFMMTEARARDDALAGLMAEVARRLVPLFPARRTVAKQLAPAVPRDPVTATGEDRLPRALGLVCRLLEGLATPAVLVAAEDRAIAWANRAACAAFGFTKEELLCIPVTQLYVDVSDFDDFAQRAQAFLNNGKSLRHRFRIQRKGGARFVAEQLVVPLGELGGQRLLVSLTNDLSESVRLAFGRRLEQLSTREQEVFQLTVVGATVPEIAERLSLSPRTVEGHRSRLLRKLGCATTTKLLAQLLADSVGERVRL